MYHNPARRPVLTFLAAAGLALAIAAPFDPALAGGSGVHQGGGSMPGGPMPGGVCAPPSGGKTITINKPITIIKPVTINKNIDITKNIDNSKNITINKNIDNSKNIEINKTIIINKGGASSAEASAMATAFAQAMASANANVTVNVNAGANAGANSGGNVSYYSNSYSETQIVNRGGGEIGQVETAPRCTMQAASVVKSIHAVCVAANGTEFPASHMTGETWIDSGYEGEVARCLPGSWLKVTIGDVVQSDQGLAAGYHEGLQLTCGAHQALRHYKDGLLKCAEAVPVPDCTERTNLRRFGTGDMFFTYRTEVCLPGRNAEAALTLSGLSLNGGVGD